MKTTINILGMSCVHCVQSVHESLLKLDGVFNVNVILSENKAEIEYDDSKLNVENLNNCIEDIGFEVKK